MSKTDSREIRKFGLIAFLFFGSLCGLGLLMSKSVPVFIFGFLSLIGVGFILFPVPLRFVYKGWMTVAHLVGRIVTTVILSLVYYAVITPSGLIKRLFGGRPLPIKPDRGASSYWIARTEPLQTGKRFLKRY